MMIEDSQSDAFNTFLMQCGLKPHFKSNNDLSVRLYHDLNIYGDIAESCIEALHNDFQVDISNFDFNKYFPPEYYGGNNAQRIILWLFPFLRSKIINSQDYQPLTFSDLRKAIEEKKLK